MNVKKLQLNKNVEEAISNCEEKGHIQQVAYSAYHKAITQKWLSYID